MERLNCLIIKSLLHSPLTSYTGLLITDILLHVERQRQGWTEITTIPGWEHVSVFLFQSEYTRLWEKCCATTHLFVLWFQGHRLPLKFLSHLGQQFSRLSKRILFFCGHWPVWHMNHSSIKKKPNSRNEPWLWLHVTNNLERNTKRQLSAL